MGRIPDQHVARGYVSQLVFYLAPVEAFVEPAVVVPNIGGKNNSYMWLKPRQTWGESFVKWLQEPYRLDDLSDSEAASSTESEVDEVQNDDDSVANSDSEEEEEATDSEDENAITEFEAQLEGK